MNAAFLLILASLLTSSFTISCEQKGLKDLKKVSGSASNLQFTNAAASNGVIFEETFEGLVPFATAHIKEIGDWDYALSYVTNPAFEGSKAVRFEIKKGQPLVKNGKRAEVTIIKGNKLPSKNMWYSYAVYFPEDYDKDQEQEIITQWYQDRTPATAVRTKDNRVILVTGNNNSPDNRIKLTLGPINKGRWSTFIFHFIHSPGANGLIEVWRDGAKVLTHNGGNMYGVNILPKFKVGLYKSSFKYGTSSVNKRVIYFDNIKVGGPQSTLAIMNPSSAPLTTPPVISKSIIANSLSFTLINAETEKDIMTIKNGDVLSLSALGTKKINIRANANASSVGMVKFILTGAERKSKQDEVMPYALFGDDKSGNYYTWVPSLGKYSLKATTYANTKDTIDTSKGKTYTIDFTITK
jgi:hypothetical protein